MAAAISASGAGSGVDLGKVNLSQVRSSISSTLDSESVKQASHQFASLKSEQCTRLILSSAMVDFQKQVPAR